MSVDVDWEYEDITLERVSLSGCASLLSVSMSAIPFICMSLSQSCRRSPDTYISGDWSGCVAYLSRESWVCRSTDFHRSTLSMHWDSLLECTTTAPPARAVDAPIR